MANKLKKKRHLREKRPPIYQFRGGLGNFTKIDIRAWLRDKIMPFKIMVVIICISVVLACSSSAG